MVVFRDGVEVETIDAGTETASYSLADGLYSWTLKTRVGATDSDATTAVVMGCMTADVYVDADNGSDSNDGSTPALAVATLHHAGALMDTPGMVMAVRGGTYLGYEARFSYDGTVVRDTSFTTSGTSGSRMYLKSFPGEDVVLDGSQHDRAWVVANYPGGDSRDPVMLHISANYWTVTGWPRLPDHRVRQHG